MPRLVRVGDRRRSRYGWRSRNRAFLIVNYSVFVVVVGVCGNAQCCGEIGHRLEAVAWLCFHGSAYGGNSLATDIVGTQCRLGKFYQHVRCHRRTLPGEHLKQRRTKGINVHRDGEHLSFAVIGLFYGRISRGTAADSGARLWLAILVILFRQAEVNQHRLAIIAQHHISRLQVQVQHAMAVHERQRPSYLTSVTQCLGLGQTAAPGYQVVKAPAAAIFHRVISCTISFKRFEHINYTRVLQLSQIACFARKFALVIDKQAALATLRNFTTLALVDVAHEKLFHCHSHLGIQATEVASNRDCRSSQIGYAKRTLPQHLVNDILIFKSLQHRSGPQCHFISFHIRVLFLDLCLPPGCTQHSSTLQI